MATATSGSDISFLVPGEAAATRGAPAGPARGVRKASVRVGVQRSGGEALRVSARPGEDVVVLGIANGPTLVLHPEDARDLLRAQAAGATRSEIGRAHV